MDLFEIHNFAPDALTVRDAVIRGGFTDEIGPDGALYTGISQYPVPHWPSLIALALGVTIEPKLTCFRLNLAGELPHSWVHSDGICADYASVLYLNLPEQCYGGTAFWRHRELEIDRIPRKHDLALGAHITAEWKRLEPWERTDFVPMEWNKFVTYPTERFHSRYPFEGFGQGPQDGRLIWICFYDVSEVKL